MIYNYNFPDKTLTSSAAGDSLKYKHEVAIVNVWIGGFLCAKTCRCCDLWISYRVCVCVCGIHNHDAAHIFVTCTCILKFCTALKFLAKYCTALKFLAKHITLSRSKGENEERRRNICLTLFKIVEVWWSCFEEMNLWYLSEHCVYDFRCGMDANACTSLPSFRS